MKRATGLTLIEVVLATTIAAVFISAFLVQYSLQQTNFQAASDEIRLPAAGNQALSRAIGQEGLLGTWLPRAGTSFITPQNVTLPLNSGGTWNRVIRFDTAPDSTAGGIRSQDFTPGAQSEIALTSPTLIATMSFYSPEMITVIPGGQFATSDSTYTAWAVKNAGNTAFYVLGAALRSGVDTTGNKTLRIRHVPGTNDWEFQFGLDTTPITFAPGRTFTLDGRAVQGGTLVCAWPLMQTVGALNFDSLSYTLNAVTTARRVGLWIRLNTSPYTGLIDMRDSLALRH